MSNLLEHASYELERAGLTTGDEYGRAVSDAVLKLMEVFVNQEHSGLSANIVTDIFNRLTNFEPLTPLTGEDDEWVELNYSDEVYYQNRRCPSVFKRVDGTAYNIDGIVFVDELGVASTSKESFVEITFPYKVTKEIVFRNSAEDNKS